MQEASGNATHFGQHSSARVKAQWAMAQLQFCIDMIGM